MTPVPWVRVWWALGVVFVTLAAYVCLAPGDEIPGAVEMNDKFMHALGHCLLAIYFCGLVPRQRWYLVLIGLLSFGIGIEIAQHFMHVGRQADRYDVIANSLGMIAGMTLSHFGLNRWPRWVAWTLGKRTVA